MLFPPKQSSRKGNTAHITKIPKEGFRIDFEDTATITADSPAAQFYAESLLKELSQSKIPPQAGEVIIDWPSISQRGFMLDISRNRVPTMDWLKQLIDHLTQLRYNELQLYTEHTFAYKDHESVWKHASPFTADEIQELDRYCSARHIELVPNQNTFGHMERWLRHPDYKHLAESPDGFLHPISGPRPHGSTLYPSRESVLFVESLLKELCPHFSSNKIHIGGDEPWELGQGRSREAVTEKGKHIIYLDYMRQVADIATKEGKAPQLWADVIMERPDLVAELPTEIIPVIWGYEADSPFDQQAAIVKKAGFANQFYLAPGAGTWNSFGGRLEVARANIANAAQAAIKHQALGLLLTAWGDNGHHQPWSTLFPPLILQAEAAWGCSLSEQSLLAEKIDTVFYTDNTSPQGKILCELGTIDTRLTQPAPPNSFLHSVFFADTEKSNSLCQSIELDQIKEVLAAIESLSTQALDSESLLALMLNRHSAEIGYNLLSKEKIQPTDSVDRIKEIFAEDWLVKARPGGLQESLDRFPN